MKPYTPLDEEEISLKEIGNVLYRYRYMIFLFIVLSGLISGYIAYFKPNVYRASASVEVGLEGMQRGGNDILSSAMGVPMQLFNTEKEIITSRYLANIALKHVDFTHRYYTTRYYKEVELYKEAPFNVGMLKGYGISFNYYPVDKKHYRLEVSEAVDENGTSWSYDKILSYGQEVVTPHFHLNIVATGEPKENAYRFVVHRHNTPVGKVSVSQRSQGTTILHISYEDNVAQRAKEYANALAEAYIAQSIENKTRQATLQLDFLDKQLKEIRKNLRGSAIKIEEFKKGANTVSLSSKAKNIIRKMSEAEAKLEALSIESQMLDNLYRQIRKGKNLESISITGLDKATTASLIETIAQLQDAIIKKKILREDYTEMYPDVIKLSKQIRELKKIIKVTIKNLRSNMKKRQALLEKSVQKYQRQLNKIPADERMYGQLERKFSVNEKIYSYLLEKRSATAIIKASTVSKNRIIDRALTPNKPVKPKRNLIVIVGLILGLIAGMIVAFLRHYFDDRIRTEEEVTKAVDVPLLGSVPYMKENDDGNLKVLDAPKSAVAESFRNIRTNLQFMGIEGGSHVITVTSTIGGEGKTTICTNLAAIMSIADKKTIILNLDMRKPTLHERFHVPNIHGMSTLLSQNIALKDVIQHTKYENIDVITSGPVPPNPSELIQGDMIEKIVESLREVYDIIIIDTPPIGLVSDARTLMHLADTSIYVLRVGYSRRGFIRNIKYLSGLKEIHDLTILINDVKTENYGYGYGYGYGYYEDDKK